jgi:hypothetical protein
MAYAALHAMWPLFIVIVVASAIIGWFGRKAADWRPPTRK